MGLGKSLNQSLRGGSKKASSMSSNGLPRNYRGVLEVNLKTCAKGTKLRVYKSSGYIEQSSKKSRVLEAWWDSSDSENFANCHEYEMEFLNNGSDEDQIKIAENLQVRCVNGQEKVHVSAFEQSKLYNDDFFQARARTI
ncbi:hypothetical protein PVL29_027156 [Vitis rotundifolia]|uniref:Uncharacterized protein n=1 Tax=Vitis rotundifolia TaxID=103349 RepID=A0AA39D5U0_VITRO|nr:hypothetical protein PVL29_027156 [Vitis rotundifolia]